MMPISTEAIKKTMGKRFSHRYVRTYIPDSPGVIGLEDGSSGTRPIRTSAHTRMIIEINVIFLALLNTLMALTHHISHLKLILPCSALKINISQNFLT